ncbi:hypothetical protein JCM3765_003733 [Sporobolomyces pararoseus]
MYGTQPIQQYHSPPYNYSNPPPLLPHPSTSTSLQALSQAALGHSNGGQFDRNGLREIQPAAPAESEEGRSLSPSSATVKEEDTKDGKVAKGGTKGKQPGKRGRKRIQEDSAAADTNDGLDADAKRKLQNRAAQRAFRERKERRVIDLEEKVNQQEAELAQCREIIDQLRRENDALRRGENPPPTPSTSVPNGKSTSPPDVKPAVEDTPRPSSIASPSFQNILNEASDHPPPPSTSTPQFQTATPNDAPMNLPSLTEGASSASSAPPPVPPVETNQTSPNLDDLDLLKLDSSFDFDAPFDFSESMALPPLFASLLDDLSLPPSTNTDNDEQPQSTENSSTLTPIPQSQDQPMTFHDAPSSSTNLKPTQPRTADNCDEGMDEDDEDPPPLPLGRIPCDKPECDFTAVSCALPIPWRPPNAPTGSEDKDLWIAQKCWAKLISHPLFDRCDSDELCQELRDKTRCSDDGRLVCHKNDVCAIFRSIPQKAKLKQLLQE